MKKTLGKTIYSAQRGISNMEYKIPITDSTTFHIASVSKQFTAFLAVSLEKEGKLSLDDDIGKYLPELKGLSYKISLRQLKLLPLLIQKFLYSLS